MRRVQKEASAEKSLQPHILQALKPQPVDNTDPKKSANFRTANLTQGF